jgi:hypothetical protein
MVAKPLLRLLKPRFVDIEPDDVCSRKPELIRYEAGRAPDVEYFQAAEVLSPEKVPENGQDLGGLAPASLLVEHLGLELGVRKLQWLGPGTGWAVPRLAFLTRQLFRSA